VVKKPPRFFRLVKKAKSTRLFKILLRKLSIGGNEHTSSGIYPQPNKVTGSDKVFYFKMSRQNKDSIYYYGITTNDQEGKSVKTIVIIAQCSSAETNEDKLYRNMMGGKVK